MFNWFTAWKDGQLQRYICKNKALDGLDYTGVKKPLRIHTTSALVDGIVAVWLMRQSVFTRRFYTPPKFKYVTSGDKVRICMYR